MATLQPISRSYNGIISSLYFKELVASAPTIEGGYAQIVTGVKGRVNIPDFFLDPGLKRRDECTSEAAGEFGMNNNTIEVCPLEINGKLCHAKYDNIYDNQSPYEYTLPGAIARQVPELQNRIFMELLVRQVARRVEGIIWSGTNTAVGYQPPADFLTLCDGWLKRIDESGDANTFGPLSPSGPAVGGINAGNIIDLLQQLWENLPTIVTQDADYEENLTFYLAADYKKYMQIAMLEYMKQGAADAPIRPTENRNVWLWMNTYPIVFTSGIDGTGNDPFGSGISALLTFDNNLWVGMDLMSDIENFSIKNLQQNDPADRNTRYYGGFNLGTQVWKPEYVSAYLAQ